MTQILGQGFIVTQGCPERIAFYGFERPKEEYPYQCYVVPVSSCLHNMVCKGKIYQVVGFHSQKPWYFYNEDGTKCYKTDDISDIYVCEHNGHFVE